MWFLASFSLGLFIGFYSYGLILRRTLDRLEVSALEWDERILGYRAKRLPAKIKKGTILGIKAPFDLETTRNVEVE